MEAELQPLEYRRFMFVGVGILPYLKIPVSPAVANRMDKLMGWPRLLNFLFVNQLFVARG